MLHYGNPGKKLRDGKPTETSWFRINWFFFGYVGETVAFPQNPYRLHHENRAPAISLRSNCSGMMPSEMPQGPPFKGMRGRGGVVDEGFSP